MKDAHWNAKGKEFFQLHLLFDKIHDEVGAFVDLVAERTAALGGTAMAAYKPWQAHRSFRGRRRGSGSKTRRLRALSILPTPAMRCFCVFSGIPIGVSDPVYRRSGLFVSVFGLLSTWPLSCAWSAITPLSSSTRIGLVNRKRRIGAAIWAICFGACVRDRRFPVQKADSALSGSGSPSKRIVRIRAR